MEFSGHFPVLGALLSGIGSWLFGVFAWLPRVGSWLPGVGEAEWSASMRYPGAWFWCL